MITNITITCTTDDPNHAPVTLDLSTPGVSFFLDHLAGEICPCIPAAYPPGGSYDYSPSIAKCLKDSSNDLQLHREGEYDANRKTRDTISKHALDEMAQLIDQLAHDETINSASELPADFKKKLFDLGDILRTVGTSWKKIVEDFHRRVPMDEATKKKHLENGCFPEELVVWKYDA